MRVKNANIVNGLCLRNTTSTARPYAMPASIAPKTQNRGERLQHRKLSNPQTINMVVVCYMRNLSCAHERLKFHLSHLYKQQRDTQSLQHTHPRRNQLNLHRLYPHQPVENVKPQIHHKRQPRVRIDSLGIWLRKHDIDRHRLTRRTNKPRLNALHE